LDRHPDVVGVSVGDESCIPKERMVKKLFDGTTSGPEDFNVDVVSRHHVSSARSTA
jgi:hypothetical protein